MKSILIIAVAAICSCAQNSTPTVNAAEPEVPVEHSADAAKRYTDFRSYWNRGLAEMNRYELSKGRYSETHAGETVFIFVTEPFRSDTQVKSDDGNHPNAVPVLKLNASERFYTGVYPYTTLTSVFSPTNGERAIKIMSTMQEWCGAVWVQLNSNEQGYRAKSFSYFETEGDQDLQLPKSNYEDEIWTMLRISPDKLPTGKIEMVPAMTYLRLAHKPYRAYSATAELKRDQTSPYWDEKVSIYEVNFPELDRVVTVHFEPNFPYRIVGFDETRKGIFGPELKTSGRLTNSIMLDYWDKHNNRDAPFRSALGLQH